MGWSEALDLPQIPRKIDFELVFWAGPRAGPMAAAFGRGRKLSLRPLGDFFLQKMTLKNWHTFSKSMRNQHFPQTLTFYSCFEALDLSK